MGFLIIWISGFFSWRCCENNKFAHRLLFFGFNGNTTSRSQHTITSLCSTKASIHKYDYRLSIKFAQFFVKPCQREAHLCWFAVSVGRKQICCLVFLVRYAMSCIIEDDIHVAVISVGNLFYIIESREHRTKCSILIFTNVLHGYAKCLLAILRKYVHVIIGKRNLWHKVVVLVAYCNDKSVRL